tara:strand:- start:1530 stop:2108 length:579 start_codon:yes stop_codon:yes gene_type:complete
MSSLAYAFDPRGLGLVGRLTVFAGLGIVVLDELGTFRDPVLTRSSVFLLLGAVCSVGSLASQGGGRATFERAAFRASPLLPVFVRTIALFTIFTVALLLRAPGRGAFDVMWGVAGAALGLRAAAHAARAAGDPLFRILTPLALMAAVSILLPDRPWLVLGPLAVAAWALHGFREVWRQDGVLVFEIWRSDGR